MSWKDLEIQNPWWRGATLIEEDPHLKAIRGKSYAFDRPLRHDLHMGEGDVHLLRGPRQVGKTTLIKGLIHDLIVDRRVSGMQILYLSCEAMEHFESLRTILVEWLQSRSGKTYLFLDEISFVREWQRAILWLSNAGLLQQSILVLTGSNARDLKESAERLPGRRGHGLDHPVYPLSLQDYRLLPCFKNKTQAELWQIYREVGGFPHAIRDFSELGEVSDETFITYRNWIIGDAARFELSELVLKHILFRIFETVSSRITWPKLIEQTPIRSHETALAYVEHLQDVFLCTVLPCYDPNKKGPAPQKARKLYFIDPLLYYVAAAWHKGLTRVAAWSREACHDPGFQGKLLEAVVVSDMARREATLYFWYSSQSQQEVDIVVPQGDQLVLYDVKLSAGLIPPALGLPVQVITAQSLGGGS